MNVAITLLTSGFLCAGPEQDNTGQLLRAIHRFESAISCPNSPASDIARLSGEGSDQRTVHFTDGHSGTVRLRDLLVRSYQSVRRETHARYNVREVRLLLTTDQQIRERATDLAERIGQGSGWKIDEVRVTPEKRGIGDRMESYGTASVTFRRTADPVCFHGGNRMGFGIDLFDGAVLYFGITDHVVFVQEEVDLGEQRARQAVATLLAALDEETYPREWREPVSIERGWSVPDREWFTAFQREHGRPCETIPAFPAYKVHLAPCLELGVPRKAWVIVRASTGEVLHSDVFGS